MDLVSITFWFSSSFIFPMWVLMWFLPKHDITRKIVGNLKICIFPLIASYFILLLPNMGKVLITLASDMPTPEIVVELFSTEQMIILAWLHFLVMDTFIGRYIWMRMLAAGRPIQISAPVLITCMMLGPIGLLAGVIATLDVEDDISVPTRPIE